MFCVIKKLCLINELSAFEVLLNVMTKGMTPLGSGSQIGLFEEIERSASTLA